MTEVERFLAFQASRGNWIIAITGEMVVELGGDAPPDFTFCRECWVWYRGGRRKHGALEP